MISFSFKESEGGKYLTLQDIKTLKLALHNRNGNTKDMFSSGWSNSLRNAGNKYVIFKVNGISCGSHAEVVLRKYAFSNDFIDCTLSLCSRSQEVVHARCTVELYEKYYEAGDLESFNVVLLSTGTVSYSDHVR